MDKLLGELEVAFVGTELRPQEFWVVNVPSSSEELAEHRAWNRVDGHWVEPEYRARLRAAYLLLASGIARYIFISGGEVDTEACDPRLQPNGTTVIYPHIDALLGKLEFLESYGEHWESVPLEFRADLRTGIPDPLESRVLVDPYALHTETNVRNCDRFCAHVGLDRNLIATTFGAPRDLYGRVGPGGISDHPPRHVGFGQGDYYAGLLPGTVAFPVGYMNRVAYDPGRFNQLPTDVDIHNHTCPIGRGIFGTGLSAFIREGRVQELDPALAWIPFVSALWGNTPSPDEFQDWTTGIIFHDKLSVHHLRHDERFAEPGN